MKEKEKTKEEKTSLRPSPTALLNPRMDVNFKAIFTQETEESNEALKSLYKHAYALMLLSKFEGFGIPPLEALLNGTKTIILSDIEVFHEIYGDKANYIINNEIDLNNLKMADEEYINELVNKYNWSRVSSNILDILKVK